MTRALRYHDVDGRVVIVRADRACAVADLGDGTARVELHDGDGGVSEVVQGTADVIARDLGWDVVQPPTVDLAALGVG